MSMLCLINCWNDNWSYQNQASTKWSLIGNSLISNSVVDNKVEWPEIRWFPSQLEFVAYSLESET